MFNADLKFSQNVNSNHELDEYYRKVWPDLTTITKAPNDSDEQRRGIDKIITLQSGKVLTGDENIRRQHFDDFLLEEYRNLGRKRPGWTVDPELYTDFIAYMTPKTIKLLPFDVLRRTCIAHLPEWRRGRNPIKVPNGSYVTLNWAIRWDELFSAMLKTMGNETTIIPE